MFIPFGYRAEDHAEILQRMAVIKAAGLSKVKSGHPTALTIKELDALDFSPPPLPVSARTITQKDVLAAAAYLHAAGQPVCNEYLCKEMNIADNGFYRKRLTATISLLRRAERWPYTLVIGKSGPKPKDGGHVRSSDIAPQALGQPERPGLRAVPTVPGAPRRQQPAWHIGRQPRRHQLPAVTIKPEAPPAPAEPRDRTVYCQPGTIGVPVIQSDPEPARTEASAGGSDNGGKTLDRPAGNALSFFGRLRRDLAKRYPGS